jgi:hypothetical protein
MEEAASSNLALSIYYFYDYFKATKGIALPSARIAPSEQERAVFYFAEYFSFGG